MIAPTVADVGRYVKRLSAAATMLGQHKWGGAEPNVNGKYKLWRIRTFGARCVMGITA